MRSAWVICIVMVAALTLSGCGDPYRDELNARIQGAEMRLSELKDSLNSGSLRNGLILKEYAKQVVRVRPEMEAVIDALVKDGTVDGQLYKHLEQRLGDLKKTYKQYGDPEKLLPEADAIMLASTSRIFNKALSDPINVLADLSNGTLPRIDVMSKQDEATFNDVKDFGDASQLVGNPAYGNWSNSGGMSVWQFVGAYAIMNSLMGSRPIHYDSWNRHRPYSRHQDDRELGAYSGSRYGRDGSSSQRGRSTYSKSPTTAGAQKTYSGTSKTSTYGKGSGVSYRGNSAPRKTSSYSSKSRTSGYSGSLRNGSSHSRGTFGGK